MRKFTVSEKYISEEKSHCWSVSRYDGCSFRDGVLSYNFPYTEQGAIDALACAKQLDQEHEF